MSDHHYLQQRISASKNNEHPLDVRDDDLPPRDDTEEDDD